MNEEEDEEELPATKGDGEMEWMVLWHCHPPVTAQSAPTEVE